ncbi:HU family DNA-binding protein [uncultured Bacteroides sp.]|uniref:HU family DNA-binding protein n=1 Tax=uncultured Bacteroides sp. TaxID=162156 RepID=UPI00260CCB0A|nr:HU family DNA-binding protein [uncultured Bacteroides sp.]
MNGEEFLNLLSEKIKCDGKKTARLVSSLTEVIIGELQDGKSVSLHGLGAFEVRKKLERIVVNPVTGKRTLFPPKLVVGFRPSVTLKDKVGISGDKK